MSDNISAFSAADYNEKIRRTIPFYDELYKQLADAVRTCRSAPLAWLDAGCGTGRTAETAFAELPIERFVFCDTSPEMLEIAKERFGDRKKCNTEFILSDVRELDFHSCFDVVTAVQVNHYLDRQGRTLAVKKCCEALKPGGVFITFENFAPGSETGKKLYLRRWENFQRDNGRPAADCAEHISRYGRKYFPITVPEHLQLLKDCGFRTAEILWLSYMQVGLIGIK